MIVTITVNPAIDKSTSFQKLIPEKKMRCSEMTIEAGGGGINVSKVLKELAGESIAVFPSGGANGKLLEQTLSNSNIPFKAIPIENETRENFTATELLTNAQYRFVMPGASLNIQELNKCFNVIKDIHPNPHFIVFSGSLAPGMADSIVAQFAVMAKELNAKFIVDTSGEPLKNAVREGVFLVKPNLSELCSLVGKEFLELSEVDNAAKSIIEKGHTEVIVVSMGPSGALLVTKDLCKRVPAPIVKKQSTVGAGDSMVAGISFMLMQNKPLIEAVQFGVACGTAAIMNKGTQLCRKEDVGKLFDWIRTNSSN